MTKHRTVPELTPQQRRAFFESVAKVVEYGLDDGLLGEHKHWEECGKPKNHIYHQFRKLQQWAEQEAVRLAQMNV